MAIQKIYISTKLQADLESEIEGRNRGTSLS
jgi:hypothetical protein